MAVKDLSALPLNTSQSVIQDDPKLADSWKILSFSILNLEFGQLQLGSH
jgi:hypothetical protein